jgi:hypothetical protein
VRDQALKPWRAESTASSTSAWQASATSAMASPLAGLTTLILALDWLAMAWLWM